MDVVDWKHAPSLLFPAINFALIIWLFTFILRSLPRNWRTAPTSPIPFVLLTLTSLVHTCYYRFQYFKWTFNEYEQSLQHPITLEGLLSRAGFWLCDTPLNTETQRAVSRDPLNWWWSEQMFLFQAGIWALFFVTEGRRHKMKHVWAYMLLGVLVGISVASNLFFLALVLSPSFADREEREKEHWVSLTLAFNIFATISQITLSTHSKEHFVNNLLTVHGLVFLPLSYKESPTPSPYAIPLRTVYRALTVWAVFIHGRATLKVVDILRNQGALDASSILQTVWTVLHSHPAQSRICWDLVWTGVSFIVWTMMKPKDATDQPKWFSVPFLLAFTPLTSIAVAAPLTLAPKKMPKQEEAHLEVKAQEKYSIPQ